MGGSGEPGVDLGEGLAGLRGVAILEGLTDGVNGLEVGGRAGVAGGDGAERGEKVGGRGRETAGGAGGLLMPG